MLFPQIGEFLAIHLGFEMDSLGARVIEKPLNTGIVDLCHLNAHWRGLA